MRGEDKKDYLLRLLKEGHTAPDAMMTCACAQVGQVSEERGAEDGCVSHSVMGHSV